MRQQNNRPRRAVSAFAGREGIRLAVLLVATIMIVAVLFGGVDGIVNILKKSTETEMEMVPQRPPVAAIDIPIFDSTLVLEKTKDATSFQRYESEPEPYEHLLLFANKMVSSPAAWRLLGIERGHVADLQEHPERYRGKPFWFEGEVTDLSPPVPIQGLLRTFRTEGVLQTEYQGRVMFAVVEPIPQDLTLGSYARIEGMFFKLRDRRIPTPAFEKAPFLVGAGLRPAFKDFEPVKELDPNTLSLAKDATDSEMDVIHPVPLYHLCSYAMNHAPDAEARKKWPQLTRAAAEKLVANDPEYPRGSGYRIVASLFWVRSVAAEPNPLGVEWWTDVWIEHPRVGTIAIRIPKRVEGEWKTGDYVVLYGRYLQKHRYEVGNPKMWERGSKAIISHEQRFKIVPYFLATELIRWELVEHPADSWVRLTLVTIAALLICLLCLLVIRDNRADTEIVNRIVERRKRRRLRTQ